MSRVYHLGLVAGPNEYEDVPEGTVVLQVRESVDYLSCELWQYLGRRVTTKKDLHDKRQDLLDYVNQRFGQHFRRLVVR